MIQPLWKIVCKFLIKWNILFPCDPDIALVIIYLREPKPYVHTETCALNVIARLLIIAKLKERPTCPSVDKWISKQWYIQTMEYYLALKRNELSSHEKTWRNLNKCTLPSERSQSLRLHTIWFQRIYLLCDILKKAIMEPVKRSLVARGSGREKEDEMAEHRGLLGQWKYYDL